MILRKSLINLQDYHIIRHHSHLFGTFIRGRATSNNTRDTTLSTQSTRHRTGGRHADTTQSMGLREHVGDRARRRLNRVACRRSTNEQQHPAPHEEIYERERETRQRDLESTYQRIREIVSLTLTRPKQQRNFDRAQREKENRRSIT